MVAEAAPVATSGATEPAAAPVAPAGATEPAAAPVAAAAGKRDKWDST